MNDVIIRPYKTDDIPALCDIWQEAFGDEKPLIDRFFALLPEMGRGFVAEKCSAVVGMLYVLDAQLGEKSVGYVYAVAVKTEHRTQGIGQLLCKTAAGLLYDIIATLPAEDSLYAWYEKLLETNRVLFAEYENIPAGEGDEYREINAAEYGKLREGLLEGRAHTVFPESYLRFQETICKTYGGGMYAGDNGLACGYIEDGALQIKEALGDISFLPTLCRDLGASCAVIRKAAPSGERFISATGKLPVDCEWNLALD